MKLLRPGEQSQVSIQNYSETEEGILLKLSIAIGTEKDESEGSKDYDTHNDYHLELFQIECQEYRPANYGTFFVEDQRIKDVETLLSLCEKDILYPTITIYKAHPEVIISLPQELGKYLTRDKDYEDLFHFQALLPKDSIVEAVLCEIRTFTEDYPSFAKNSISYPESHLLSLLTTLAIKALRPINSPLEV